MTSSTGMESCCHQILEWNLVTSHMFFFLQVFQQYFCKSSLPPLNPITEKGYVVSATNLCSHRKSGNFHVTLIHKKLFMVLNFCGSFCKFL